MEMSLRVRTERGTVSTSTVICVAGPWSRAIGAMAGVDLPVQPVARPIWYTEPMPNRPERVPMTIDFTTGFYFHSEGPGLLFGMADPDQPPGFDAPMRADWLEVVGDVVAHRAPALLDVGIAGGWHGYYETTPDHNALIGEAEHVSRFIYATGFSGHGFLLGPAVGEVLRDLVMGQAPPVDVSGFDVERFTRRDPPRAQHRLDPAPGAVRLPVAPTSLRAPVSSAPSGSRPMGRGQDQVAIGAPRTVVSTVTPRPGVCGAAPRPLTERGE